MGPGNDCQWLLTSQREDKPFFTHILKEVHTITYGMLCPQSPIQLEESGQAWGVREGLAEIRFQGIL